MSSVNWGDVLKAAGFGTGGAGAFTVLRYALIRSGKWMYKNRKKLVQTNEIWTGDEGEDATHPTIRTTTTVDRVEDLPMPSPGATIQFAMDELHKIVLSLRSEVERLTKRMHTFEDGDKAKQERIYVLEKMLADVTLEKEKLKHKLGTRDSQLADSNKKIVDLNILARSLERELAALKKEKGTVEQEGDNNATA